MLAEEGLGQRHVVIRYVPVFCPHIDLTKKHEISRIGLMDIDWSFHVVSLDT